MADNLFALAANFEFDIRADRIDVRAMTERVDELREQRADRYVAGWNTPGYTPDEFDDLDDARTYIADELREQADRIEDDADVHADSPDDEHTDEVREQAEALRDAARTLEASTDDGDFAATLGGTDYWITKDGTMGLDEDEAAELAALESILDDLRGYGGDHQWEGDWYPLMLIAESDFEDHARELAEETGAIDADARWPMNCIDWQAAARELRTDYSEVDIDDKAYFYR